MKKLLILTLPLILFYISTAQAEDAPAEKELPKVLVIGDSISLGYTPHVAKMLKDQAIVRHHRGNAQHTATGLLKLDQWIGDTQWDVIHFNWGLWDLCYRHPDSKVQGNRDKVNGTVTIPLDQYEKNLDALVTRLETTGATLIWAHTTVVPENEAGRIVGDDKKYNDVATRIMRRHGVAINDLHALTRRFSPDLFTAPGNVHYTEAGYRRIAQQVADKIRTVGGVTASEAKKTAQVAGAERPNILLIIYTNDNGACSEHLSGDGWSTARNVMEWAKAQGKRISVGDNMEMDSGGPMTFHSVGHNWANAQNTPLRRYKANVHEGGACVPCIMHWPQGLTPPGGTITDQRGHMVDILATCIELAGASYPDTLHGQRILPNEGTSLLATIQGRKQDPQHAYYFNHAGTHAVIKGDWKIVREGAEKGTWHLYNLTQEKTEITDHAARMPETVKELAALWEARFGSVQ